MSIAESVRPKPFLVSGEDDREFFLDHARREYRLRPEGSRLAVVRRRKGLCERITLSGALSAAFGGDDREMTAARVWRISLDDPHRHIHRWGLSASAEPDDVWFSRRPHRRFRVRDFREGDPLPLVKDSFSVVERGGRVEPEPRAYWREELAFEETDEFAAAMLARQSDFFAGLECSR